jgi:hypothetical protein
MEFRFKSLYQHGGTSVALTACSRACAMPIFLVIGSVLAAGTPLVVASQFVSYALGMGSVPMAVILGAAFFQSAVTQWVRGIAPYVHHLAAAFLSGAGMFVTPC